MSLTDDWEKGVRDAWDYLRFKADQLETENAFVRVKWQTLKGILDDLDPVIYTLAFARNRDKEEDDEFREGDIVTDFESQCRR